MLPLSQTPLSPKTTAPGAAAPRLRAAGSKKDSLPPPWHAARATSTGAIYPAFAGTRGEVRGTFPQNG